MTMAMVRFCDTCAGMRLRAMRDPDAKCVHCSAWLCGSHIVEHLQKEHAVMCGPLTQLEVREGKYRGDKDVVVV